MTETRRVLARWDPELAYAWSYREHYLQLPFPVAEYDERLARTRSVLAAAGLAGLLVGASRAHDGDLRWLTNFRPLVGSAVLGQLFDRIGWTACIVGIGLVLGAAALLATHLRTG